MVTISILCVLFALSVGIITMLVFQREDDKRVMAGLADRVLELEDIADKRAKKVQRLKRLLTKTSQIHNRKMSQLQDELRGERTEKSRLTIRSRRDLADKNRELRGAHGLLQMLLSAPSIKDGAGDDIVVSRTQARELFVA